ncbi:DUF2147 domain-containing protein [Bradyrhizobium sp.]|uniref:DUF2147 domain-containing protein n=1 Tax=Bradyrhizobium sp. TaxID=376 RepID=UPI004037D5D7
MKRLYALMVLMAASSSADAGSISFSVGGHRIRIEAPRGCSSSSCASISIPGVYESRKKRGDEPRNVVASPPPAPAPLPAPAPVQQSAPPPIVAAAPAPAPLAVYKPASAATQEVAPPPLPPLPPVPQVQPAAAVTQPCTTPPAAKPEEPARPTPPVLKVLHEDAADSPLGDWQTEGKGMVRIAECGRALCGYAIKEGESEKGEAVLINMKPKSDTQWSGSVYSKDSGDTYYGTMRLRGPNTLRVEACAFSRFYCNGNNWIRITSKSMVTSRQVTRGPQS